MDVSILLIFHTFGVKLLLINKPYKSKTVKKFFFLLLYTACYGVYAQGNINGKIIDSKTNQALPYVNIVCKNSAKEIISGGITNNNGNFSITKLPLQKTFLEIQFIGYKTVFKELVLTKENTSIKLGTISIEEDSKLLKEVSIQSNNTIIKQKIDRRIVNVGKDLTSISTNGYELIKNIPGINVDLQSGNINIRGNKNARILIDGKPSNLTTQQVLKQISSSSIKSVELITNPSAKYSPDGMSGIVNIILKKEAKKGFNGDISFGLTQGLHTRGNTGLNFNYRSGNVNIYTNYSNDFGNLKTGYTYDRTDKNLKQRIRFDNDGTSHYFKIGTDIYLNKNNTISFYTNQGISPSDFFIKTVISENNTTILNAKNKSVFDTSESTYNLNYTVNLDEKGQKIEFEATNINTKNPEQGTFNENVNPNSKVNNYTNNITNNDTTWLFNVDYTKPLKNGASLELGAEIRNLNLDSKLFSTQEYLATDTPTYKPVGNTFFDYTRNIYASYINFNKEIGKYAFQAGLRFEQFNTKATFNNTEQASLPKISDNLFKIYPSAYATYYASEKNEFQISYSRRIDRPSIYQLSPIREWSSPYTISEGNRFLKPQFTNSFELNYTRYIKTGYLFFGTFYRKTSDIIGRSSTLDSINNDIQILSFDNYSHADNYGIEFFGSFKPIKWWTISPSIELYKQNGKGIINNQVVSYNNTYFGTRFINNIKITKRLNTQFYWLHIGKNKKLLNTVKPYNSISGSLNLKVFNGKGSINITAKDIFNILDYRFESTKPYAMIGSVTREFQNISVGFSYKFGSGKNRKRNRKDRYDNETQSGGGIL